MNDIISQLQPIFRDIFDDPALTLTRQSNAQTIRGWDSLAHMSLVSSIEQALQIRFALGELEELKNVGDMVDLISRKQAQKANP
jgi:acyl carrier protein